ncbi:MAG TPA: ABC transporter ATP-binding protein [Clostridiaceae bacterium]|nr:ABC transporter ATP-binding protein [Clostridiaceae bacterium]
MKHIVEVEGLVKKYGDLTAVKNISFSVEKGTLFAFLGTNGAGKSTTINILTTLLEKNSGDVAVLGHELGREDDAIRQGIGVVFQNSVLDDLLTVKENLAVRGALYNLSRSELEARIKDVSRHTECDSFIDRQYGKLSGGQKRRADIARAMLNRPQLLFLDEPTTGLDPKSRRAIWDAIKHMKENYGITVFLTTHYMEEAADADKVVILREGEIVADDTPTSLKEKHAMDVVKIYGASDQLLKWLEEEIIPYTIMPYHVQIEVNSPEQALNILNFTKAHGGMTSFEVIHGTLDDVFLNIMGQEEAEL